jgi:eukaryotic-like serine/threonine-protein kinase
VVIDFGIACALDSPSVTASGAVLGTPGYLAPEVLEGSDSGAEADIFSFGATLAYAATGRHPYGTGPASAVGYRVVHHAPDLEGAPGWLEPLLQECLLRNPAARPAASVLLARVSADAPGVQAVIPRSRQAFPTEVFQGASGVKDSRTVRRQGARAGAAHVQDPHVRDAQAQDVDFRAGTGGMHGLTTREWRPGRRPQAGRPSAEEARERRRVVLHRRWVIGTGLLVSLTAAAAKDPLPEVSLLLLTTYGLGMLVDGGIALFARQDRRRMTIDLAGAAGTVALWAVLGTFFSTFTLALALGTVVFVLVAILVAS